MFWLGVGRFGGFCAPWLGHSADFCNIHLFWAQFKSPRRVPPLLGQFWTLHTKSNPKKAHSRRQTGRVRPPRKRYWGKTA